MCMVATVALHLVVVVPACEKLDYVISRIPLDDQNVYPPRTNTNCSVTKSENQLALLAISPPPPPLKISTG